MCLELYTLALMGNWTQHCQLTVTVAALSSRDRLRQVLRYIPTSVIFSQSAPSLACSTMGETWATMKEKHSAYRTISKMGTSWTCCRTCMPVNISRLYTSPLSIYLLANQNVSQIRITEHWSMFFTCSYFLTPVGSLVIGLNMYSMLVEFCL